MPIRKLCQPTTSVNYLKGRRAKIQGLHPPINQHDRVKAFVPNAPKNFKGKLALRLSPPEDFHRGLHGSGPPARDQRQDEKTLQGVVAGRA